MHNKMGNDKRLCWLVSLTYNLFFSEFPLESAHLSV
jgi:hypothetical protein